MNDVGIIGLGLTRFTKHQTTLKSLVEDAVKRSLQDSGHDLRQMGAVFTGSAYAHVNGNGQNNLRDMPTGGIPIINIENACASGSCAVFEAYAWILAGLADVILAIGMDKTSWVSSGPLPMPEGRWYFDLGLMTPNWYGLQASHYMNKYDVTAEDLGRVAVKSRKLGSYNPNAHFHEQVTLEEVMASRSVATPFTLHQCCPKTDGAGAVILASKEYISKHSIDNVTWIRGTKMLSGLPAFSNDDKESSTVRKLSSSLFEETAVEPKDLDVLEVHDAFSIGEFIYSEAVGICNAGDYKNYLKQGLSMPNGGGVAVNPSGGLLCRGHPIGATGIAQIAELIWQFRGDAGQRQVNNARLGATLTMGAIEWERDTNIAVTFLLEGS